MMLIGERQTFRIAALIGTTLIALCGCGGRDDSVARLDANGPLAVVGDRLERPHPVGPPPSHPLSPIDRDAGVSARLSDRSVIWFFGDTARYGPDGGLADFKVGTAAWASAEQPFDTRDFDGGGVPTVFATPTVDFPPCPDASPVAGLWPLAAVVEPRDEVDRVIVFMQNICLGPGSAAVDRGVSVGEWVYDPADPPIDQRIEVTILNQTLFGDGDGNLGAAAFVEGKEVYVYGCSVPNTPVDPVACTVARVAFEDIAEPQRYERWTGSTWSRDAPSTALRFEEGKEKASAPIGPFSVMPLPNSDQYVMAYSPWPGFVDVVAVRVSSSPAGPWGAAKRVQLPDCGVTPARPRPCYGSNLQPAFTTPNRLALGYQNPYVADDPRRGSFLVGTVELEPGSS